jgi:putative ABC transport system ATP-binding protein
VNLYSLSLSDRSKLRAENVGIVFQRFHLIPYLSVVDNIRASVLARSVENDIDRAERLVEKLGLETRKHHVPSALSVGEQQRTAVARALFQSPKLLLADEPTGNLDSENARRILEVLSEFADEGGSVVMVTHEKDALAFAGRHLEMRDGKIMVTGEKAC